MSLIKKVRLYDGDLYNYYIETSKGPDKPWVVQELLLKCSVTLEDAIAKTRRYADAIEAKQIKNNNTLLEIKIKDAND